MCSRAKLLAAGSHLTRMCSAFVFRSHELTTLNQTVANSVRYLRFWSTKMSLY